MKKSSPGNDLSGDKLKIIASRIRHRMEEVGLTVAELAVRGDVLAHEIFEDGMRPNITRERVSKILMNGQTHVGKGAARIVSGAEVVVFADVLDVAPEWLADETSARLPVFWNIADDPKYAGRMIHLLNHYQKKTGELLVWGDSLLCSLTPPEFSEQFHLNLFAELDDIGLAKEKQAMLDSCNRVADVRRRETFDDLTQRSWTITQIVFLSELTKIAEAKGLYKDIAANVRRKCFEDLIKYTTNADFKINLIAARDEDVSQIKRYLRDFDRLGVCGGKFTIWGYHSGKVVWSEEAVTVKRHRKILEKLASKAAFRQRRQIADLLLRFCDSID